MPRKSKRKQNKYKNTNRTLLEPDIDNQVIGFAVKALGNCFFTMKCLDGKEIRCKARSRRMWIKVNDCCIVALRDFDEKNGDIIHKYKAEEVVILKKKGFIPSISVIDKEDETEFMSFDFDTI